MLSILAALPIMTDWIKCVKTNYGEATSIIFRESLGIWADINEAGKTSIDFSKNGEA